MTVNLASDVEDFLQEQMRGGACSDPAQFVNDLLRALREQQRRPFVVTPDLEHWLLAAADQQTTPLTEADFQGIRKRVRARRVATTS
jgi:Arc/MetJ-type ribon-helix-helix transcriptional regulator